MLICATIALMLAPGASADTPLEFPGDFGRWVQERVGPVVFPEKSSHTWPEFTGLAVDLGAHAVKTWVGADKPGEALERVGSEPYRELVRRFKVVHFNISPGYVATGYKGARQGVATPCPPGAIDSKMLRAVRDEWHDIALLLCRERAFPDQVFLLSVGGEINVYLGTDGAYPDFPVAEYVNACHEGKEAALAELDAASRARVYSVAELQGDKEYERFAKQWVAQFNTDLIGLSHYTFYRSVDESLAILRPCVKAIGPFGEHRLMLGEYGPSLEACNWNQAEQVRWHNEILDQAFRRHVQFAFFYEIADHEFVIKTGSHDGLVTWVPGVCPRLTWDYYQRLYRGEAASVPEIDLYERQERHPPADDGTPCANLVLTDLSASESAPEIGARVSFLATVSNTGPVASKDTAVNFFVDDRLVSWVWIGPLDPGAKAAVTSIQGDARFVWTAREGRHQATAIVDPAARNTECTTDDNTGRMWMMTAPTGRAASCKKGAS